MYIKRGTTLLICLMSLSAFASTYKSGRLKMGNRYEIHCSDGQVSQCFGFDSQPYSYYWKYPCLWACQSNGSNKALRHYDYPRNDCRFLMKMVNLPRYVQFKSLQEAQQLVGNKECARL